MMEESPMKNKLTKRFYKILFKESVEKTSTEHKLLSDTLFLLIQIK